jgi:uncharacterized protein YecT (DUF1311 family)
LAVKITLSIAILTVVLAVSAAEQPSALRSDAPSFDCSRARGRVEKSVCADRELSVLDRQTAELFALALAHSSDPGDIKREQRRWLRTRDDCEDVTCFKNSYNTRVDALATYTGRLPAAMTRELCTRLAAPETREEILALKAGNDDINNDGAPDKATACAGGTANVPCVSYVDAENRPILIQPQGFEWHTYSTLGRSTFRYENRTFSYHARDAALAQPSHVSYVTPTNREFRVCEFDTIIASAVMEGGHDVCAAVETGEGIETIEVTPIAEGDSSFGRADTVAKHRAIVDIDNDRLDETLIELSYESGGGQGCTFNYFELLDAEGKSLEPSSKSAPLRELQGLSNDGYRGRNCGNVQNRVFKFDEKIYYETNVTNQPNLVHEVRVLDGTATATLCSFAREVTTSVKAVLAE